MACWHHAVCFLAVSVLIRRHYVVYVAFGSIVSLDVYFQLQYARSITFIMLPINCVYFL